MKLDQGGLFEIVDRYASFGNHHTGTEADQATTAWLVAVLGDLGATVEEDRYTFDRCLTAATLTIEDEPVPSLPLFYSGLGAIATDAFDVVEVDYSNVGNARALNSMLPASDDGRPLVISIQGPDDLPVQCNRVSTEMLGRPAVVIAGNWTGRVGAGAHLAFRAELESASSANVIATLGSDTAPPVMITTPLTGWTPAAGERGTGLAAAIAIAVNLAADYHVVFSACSGHELDHLGLHHYLSTRDLAGTPAIHLGASVAACELDDEGTLQLGDRRMVLTTAIGETRSVIDDLVAEANWAAPDLDPPWPGEGGTWKEAGAHVLSFLGGASLFHTTDDIAAKATTPEAVQLATSAALRATRAFLKGIA